MKHKEIVSCVAFQKRAIFSLVQRRSRPNTAGERIVSLSREPIIPPGVSERQSQVQPYRKINDSLFTIPQRRSRSNTGGESGVLAPPKESIGVSGMYSTYQMVTESDK